MNTYFKKLIRLVLGKLTWKSVSPQQCNQNFSNPVAMLSVRIPQYYILKWFICNLEIFLPVLLFFPQQMLFFLSMLLLQIFKTLKECCF